MQSSVRGDGGRGDRGASLVEFALLVPVLVCLLLGMITGGVALASKNSITNAVRESARLGATLPDGGDWSSSWATSVKDRAVEQAGGDLDANELCVTVVQVAAGPDTTLGSWPAGACTVPGEPSTPAAATNGSCVVKVWAIREASLDALFFSRDVSLDADAVSLYERECAP